MAAAVERSPKRCQNGRGFTFGQSIISDFAQPTMHRYAMHPARIVTMTLLLNWGAVVFALWRLL
jgi:hypothetical protein